MDARIKARAREIFADALDLPPERRPAYLDQAAGCDAQLRARVAGLLAAYEQAGEFLASPTVDHQHDPGGVARDNAASQPAAAQERPGSTVERYKLLQLIGEGGFGSVFMAEQEEPVRRKVALKVIKLGMDTRQVIARFEAERQALALMDHPNIARVLDAGATGSGRPYFVMELVRGVAVTDYCDQHSLTPRERLELFTQICAAVQHAHTKGVIHRDIKPSNVLVTMHDGKPVPKVIDFGIAKATQQRLTDRTLFTEYKQFIGTPEYMSPEQAEMSALDVDTRSDVYSLGVLLYHLLTGTTPFDARELRSKAYDEIQRIIREVEPPRPSTRLSSLETLASVAVRRKTEPARLTRLVRGELDWIVMKAIEKDRTRRYESASALAADVRRYLDDEPVAASPPSRVYRLRKYARRHKGVLAGVGAVVLALMLGLAGTTWGLLRARSAARAATASADREMKAAAEARNSAQTADGMYTLLTNAILSATPEHGGSLNVPLRHVIDRIEAFLNGGAMRHQPASESGIHGFLGMMYNSLGQYDRAEAHFRRSVELTRSVHGGDDEQHAVTLSNLGHALTNLRKLDEAERLLREARQIAHKRVGATHRITATVVNNLGLAVLYAGRFAEAEPFFREAVSARRALPRGDGNTLVDLATVLNNLGLALRDQKKFDDARSLFEEAIEILEVAGLRRHPVLAMVRYNLAQAHYAQGRLVDAERLLRAVLELQEDILPANHPNLANTLSDLAGTLRAMGRFADARPYLERAVEIRRDSLSRRHPQYLEAVVNLAQLLLRLEDPGAAAPLIEEAVPLAREMFRGKPPDMRLATTLLAEAQLLSYRREFDAAEKAFDEGIALLRRVPDGRAALARALTDSGIFLRNVKKLAAAEERLGEALEITEALHGEDAPDVASARIKLAQVLRELGREADAQPVLRKAASFRADQSDPNHIGMLANIHSHLGGTLLFEKKYVEAERMLLESERLAGSAGLPPDTPVRSRTRRLLAELYNATGRAVEASRLQEASPLKND